MDKRRARPSYFFSLPGGGFGPPTLSISGCTFSEMLGAWPVAMGSAVPSSGNVGAGDRSVVPVLGLVAAGGVELGIGRGGEIARRRLRRRQARANEKRGSSDQ